MLVGGGVLAVGAGGLGLTRQAYNLNKDINNNRAMKNKQSSFSYMSGIGATADFAPGAALRKKLETVGRKVKNISEAVIGAGKKTRRAVDTISQGAAIQVSTRKATKDAIKKVTSEQVPTLAKAVTVPQASPSVVAPLRNVTPKASAPAVSYKTITPKKKVSNSTILKGVAAIGVGGAATGAGVAYAKRKDKRSNFAAVEQPKGLSNTDKALLVGTGLGSAAILGYKGRKFLRNRGAINYGMGATQQAGQATEDLFNRYNPAAGMGFKGPM